jgi:flavorubredoxin
MSEPISQPVEIADEVFWVGAVDWDVRQFHGHHYSTRHGTTYNAYLVRGEKTALVDTVHAPFAREMFERLESLTSGRELDYVIVNHVETDHAGSLPEVMARAPRATLICTKNGEKAIRRHFRADAWSFRQVTAGDSLDLGGRTLRFFPAPMLHWPDSMFTYLPELALLMPNDAFGQHLASSGRFDDEVDQAVLMDEASKYYANILSPFDSLVRKKIEEVREAKLDIRMIAPSHGVIWRKAPQKIVEAYLHWATSPGEKRIIVAYESMWGSTERMARAVVEGVAAAGVETRLYAVPVSDRTALVRDIVESRGLALGCATLNRRVLPAMAGLLEELRGLHPAGKLAFAFGSHGWGGGAVAVLEEALHDIEATRIRDGIKVIYRPSAEELAECKAAGRQLAEAVASSPTG